MIEEAGRLLYGRDYHRQLAAALGVARRVVQRWESGRDAVPHGVWGQLAGLVSARERECALLADRLRMGEVEAAAWAREGARYDEGVRITRELLDDQLYAKMFPGKHDG
jgi:transcriptional regulator with XRE-family HTH domain